MPGLLLFAFALGILHADSRLADPGIAATSSDGYGAVAIGWILACGLTLVGLRAHPAFFHFVTRLRGKWIAPSPRTGRRSLRVFGLILSFTLAFAAGDARLQGKLEEAARDAALAEPRAPSESSESSERDAYRIVEGRVASRRTTAWGDELLLVGVRGVDGAQPVPRRLRLLIETAAPGENRETEPSRIAGSRGQEQARDHSGRGDAFLWPGVAARLALRVRPIRSLRNPGTLDRAQSWARRGIGARARLVDPDWVLLREDRVGFSLDRLRSQTSSHSARLRRETGGVFARTGLSTGLARALALGDRSGLTSRLRGAFRELGLSHLIAVSGLHVGLVGGLVGFLVTRLLSLLPLRLPGRGIPFAWSLAGAAGAAWLYGGFTGSTVSAQRAALLLSLFAVMRMAGRSLGPARALTWSALVLLVTAPAALFELGAQLSFAACAALVLAGIWRGEAISPEPERVRERASGIGQANRSTWVWASLRVTLAASLGTAPFVLASGLPVALASPLFNLLAIPWAGGVVIPASLLAALGARVWPDPVLWLLLLPGHWTERASVAIAEAAEAAEAARSTLAPTLGGQGPVDALPLWGVLVLAVAGLLAMRRGAPRIAIAAWLVLAVGGAAPARWGPAVARPPRVVFFDMGQGDAALVEGRAGRLLVDTGSGPADGSGGAALARGLRSLGITQLDILAVTHGDLDHRGGAERLLERLRVKELWLPAGAEDDGRLAALAGVARERGTSVSWLGSRKRAVRRGDLEIEILWPRSVPAEGADSFFRADAPIRRSRNEESLVLRVRVGKARILFTGDVGRTVEAKLLERPGLLDADVLKVGHHGSRHSSTLAFLEAVSATHAVVSAPCDPARGLPNGGVLDRLVRAGSRVAWTGRDGALVLDARRGPGDPDHPELVSWGRPRRCRPTPVTRAERGSKLDVR